MFLFPGALAHILETTSPVGLEHNLFAPATYTILPTFAFRGRIITDMIAIVGADQESTFVDAPSSIDIQAYTQNAAAIHDFRRVQSIWLDPVKWLTPALFHVTRDLSGFDDAAVSIRRALLAQKALLSALFLADYVEDVVDVPQNSRHRQSAYLVNFTGYGHSQLRVDIPSLLRHEAKLGTLYNLFSYAYDSWFG